METQDWKWFTIGSLFSLIYKGTAYNAIDLLPCSPNNPKAVNYVTRTGTSNGCKCQVADDGIFDIEEGNALTIGDTTATIFYQPKRFVCGDHIVVLRSPLLNETRGLFIASILSRESPRYCYGRAFHMDVIKRTRIKLPSDKEGNPDWQWMEDYMRGTIVPKLPQKAREVFLHQFSSEPVSNNRLTLDVAGWQQFKYEELFDIKKGKRLTKADMEEGNIPFVGATDSNNGITARIANCEHLHPANTISVSYNGSIAEAYYQAKSFWATDDVNVLYPRFALNEYIALFLTTIINKEKYRFNYGRKWDKELMKNSTIKLPAKRSAAGKLEPDWQWMEDYIKGLPFSGCLR